MAGLFSTMHPANIAALRAHSARIAGEEPLPEDLEMARNALVQLEAESLPMLAAPAAAEEAAVPQIPMELPPAAPPPEQIMAPINEVLASQQASNMFPSSIQNLMDQMAARSKKSIDEQRAGQARTRDRIKQLSQMPQQLDLSPILAFADWITDDNISQAYTPPQSAEERQQQILALEELAQKQQQAISDDEMNLLKNQLYGEQLKLSQQKQQGKAAPEKITPYTKQKQKKFADASVEWLSKDRDAFVDNMVNIDHALNIFDKHIDLSGPQNVFQNQTMRKLTNPNSVVVEQAMQKAIAATLRPTLGAQFTEAEGKRIMNLTFDPDLPQSENMRRAQELRKAMARKVEATDALYAYIDANNGSDRGFPYAKYGMRSAGGSSGAASAPASSAPKVEQGATRMWNGRRYKVVGDEWVEVQ